ncbi:unnamed protein product [Ceratitis capitata]|uniref:(Mediterranean fruit fly) hypothetical protein n=1 Tax=Ceratitis capitata TaxID=7213 RepID=A0A811UMD3_CERCA|nr:unnamed protein product [Ceratitis capitata]
MSEVTAIQKTTEERRKGGVELEYLRRLLPNVQHVRAAKPKHNTTHTGAQHRSAEQQPTCPAVGLNVDIIDDGKQIGNPNPKSTGQQHNNISTQQCDNNEGAGGRVECCTYEFGCRSNSGNV